MFYGAVVKPGAAVSLNSEDGEVLHLSGACLHNPTSDERTYLVLQQNDKSHILCALKKDTVENVPLDLFVATRDGGHFKIQGKSEVHLIGYYEPLMSDSEDDDEMLEDMEGLPDDDEESIDEKTLKKLMAAQGKNKMLMEADASDDEDDEEDDDDDDDEEESDEEDEKRVEGSDSDDEEDEDEEQMLQALKQQIQQKKAAALVADEAQEKKKKISAKPSPVVPASSDASKKRKAADAPGAAKPGKQQKQTNQAPSSQGNGQFEKTVSDYLKKHGRCLISQVASACPKPSSISSKYREFLVSRPTFAVDGQHVSLKA